MGEPLPKFKNGDLVWILYLGDKIVLKVVQSYVVPGESGYHYTLETINDPPGAPTGYYQAREDELRPVRENSWDQEEI